MKDKLENFIRDHRDEFDDAEPDFRVWEKINTRLKSQSTPQPRVIHYIRAAAAAIVLLCLGVAIGIYLSQPKEPTIADVFPEFENVQSYYSRQVNEKLVELRKYGFDQTLEEDMKQTDAFIEELKKELESAPKGAEEKLIEAMIDNYKSKLGILDKVLQRIKFTKQQKQDQNDTSEI